jgi:hypothetical protein
MHESMEEMEDTEEPPQVPTRAPLIMHVLTHVSRACIDSRHAPVTHTCVCVCVCVCVFLLGFLLLQEQEAAYNLHYLLNIGGLLQDIRSRAKDVEKNVHGIHHELKGLRDITTVISERQMFAMQEQMAQNTSSLESVFRANERTSASLEVMQVVLAGSLAFQILDRVTGGWSVLQTSWGEVYIKETFVDPAGIVTPTPTAR